MENKKDFSYEEKILKFWNENKIFDKVNEKNKNNRKFNSVEGPPYPTGDIHVGHLRNWSIKDTIFRYKRLEGYNVYFRDGYDVHGLPVENKVQQKLGLKTVDDLKKFGITNFIKECKSYVNEIKNEMSHVRERFGLWLNKDYYLTSDPGYISLAWRFFKIAEEKGLLYKDYKTVAWCPHDETTLSDYEIKDTYKNLEDPSIYVKFPVLDEFKKSEYDEFLLIWTTTPWTLQANMAIAVNPNFNYVRALVELNGKKEVFILAEAKVDYIIEKLSKQNDIKLLKILETIKGEYLEGIRYKHILLEETPSQKEFVKENNKNIHSVILADYVSVDESGDDLERLEKKGYKHNLETDDEEKEEDIQQQNKPKKTEGTGLVHNAPGHGVEDFEACKKYNIPLFCPVDKKGNFTEGLFKGRYFRDVNDEVCDYLKKKGYLIFKSKITHRYPCCWRCKTPIVYRANEQWWIKRSKLKDEIIKENKNVKWFPEFARTSFNYLMKESGDWAISRQRFWGIPLPIFEDEDGNYEVIGSKEELEERTSKTFDDLHYNSIKDVVLTNKKSGKPMKLVPYIVDVWFDSGAASFASHYKDGDNIKFEDILKNYYPMNFIVEGRDQIRGWFSSLFTVGYVVTGKAPYKEVLFHEFITDKYGNKMSKSLGNGITGKEAIEMFGADATRYYLITKSSPELKVNFDKEELDNVFSYFNNLENTFKYIKSYLEEFKGIEGKVNFENLNVEDKWILYKLNKIIFNYKKNFSHYKLNLVFKDVEDFVVKDLSKTYLKIIKSRTENLDENLIYTFSEILKKVLIMLSPLIPFKTELLYKNYGDVLMNKKESLFLESFPDFDEYILKNVEKEEIDKNFDLVQNIITSILNAREKVNIGIRWPLGDVYILGRDLDTKCKPFENLIKTLTNVLNIKYENKDVEFNYIIKPNFQTLKEDFKNISEAIKVINLNKYYINKDLKNGLTENTIEGLKLDYNRHLLLNLELPKSFVYSNFEGGSVILNIKQDEILLEKGYLREFMRRVQMLRKDLNLNKKDKIIISLDDSDDYFIKLLDDWKNQIFKKLNIVEVKNKLEDYDIKKDFNIKDKKLIVSLKKI